MVRSGRPLRSLAAVALGFLVVGGVVVMGAAPAGAHAAFVSSDPEPGERLPTAPGVVTVRFSEPLIAEFSSVTVESPDGERFEGQVVGGQDRQIPVTLRGNATGVYEVEWRTVSPLDGHTLKGSFRFGVGVDPGEGGGETEGEPGGTDTLLAGLRAVEDVALLAAMGGALLTFIGRRDPALAWVRPSIRAPLLVAALAGLGVVLGEALLAAPSPSVDAVGTYLTTGSGLPRLARVALEVVGLQLAVLGRLGLASAATVGALVALASSGHARAADPAPWAVAVDAIHLTAAGLWAGALIRMPRLRPPDGWRSPQARELLRRFTPFAVPAFVIVVASGTLRSTQELTAVTDLVDSSYGRLLALKILAVLAMIPLSLRAWRWRRPVPTSEAVLAVAVVTVAAILAAFPLPPRRTAEATAGSEAQAAPVEQPRAGDLTFGLPVGDQLVGLTVRPARPGPNDLFLHPVPIGGAPIPELAVVVGRRHLRLEPCGTGCLRTATELDGGEVIRVHARKDFDVGAEVSIPQLPAPDGTSVLATVDRRMHALRTYTYDETLRPADPPVRAAYEFRVPDRMHLRLESGAETIRRGKLGWRRGGPGETWTRRELPPLEVPNFIWDQPRRRAVSVIGRDSIDGVETEIVSFYATTLGGTEIWYRLWVDGDGLVRYAEMHAAGHFMEQRFTGFDQPVEIEPPPD